MRGEAGTGDMLRIENLSKRYRGADRPALDSVSLAVGEGEFVALLGPNGAGKSTLINALSGTVRPDSGSLLVGGFDLASRDPRIKSLVGIVPQEISFDYVFKVDELLDLEAGYFGLRRDRAYARFLLERLSLWDKRRSPVRSLSGGMKRRLMIARALAHGPRLLLLDEPTAGVDLALRRDLHGFLRELAAGGMTIVLTTHYLEEAQELCERILVLDGGRLVADAPREDFLAMAGDDLTAELRPAGGGGEGLDGLLAGLGRLAPAGEGRALRLVFPKESRAKVLRALADASPRIDTLEILRPSLEEVFGKITGAKEDGHALAR
jgi:ABC-2 type transport system ATP-binding protein